GARVGEGCARAHGRRRGAPDVRARARLVAPVLPGPARLARDRGDRPHGRHRAAPGPRRRARAPDRRAGARRRSALAGRAREEARRARAARLPGRGNRTGDRSLRAVNLLPKDDRRQRGAEARRNNPLLIGGVAGTVLVTAVLCAWFLTASA